MPTNLLFPDTHIDGPDCRGAVTKIIDHLDTAEGHGSGSVGITRPPTTQGTFGERSMVLAPCGKPSQ